MSELKVANKTNVTETQNQLLTLIDEVPAQVEVIPYLRKAKSIAAKECRTHNLYDFLKREVPIMSGEIQSSAEIGAVIQTLNFPYHALRTETIMDKINNFRYIRGTIEVRVVLNAQPFQAGIMKLLYFPVLSPQDQYNSQLTTLTQMSGLSSVDVNFESRKPLVLQIPFIYPLPVYDLISQPDPYAYCRLVVYSPPSSGTVGYNIFVRWIDVDLSMPVHEKVPAWPQQMWDAESSDEEIYPEIRAIQPPPITNNRLISIWCNICFLFWALIYRFRRPIARNFSRVYQQIGEEENSTGSGGVISRVAKAVGSVALTLSGIPLLTSIAAPISTISFGVADLASYFGWSTPRNEQITTLIRPNLLNGFNNFNRVDNSHQLALDCTNKIDVTKHHFGTDLDEMAFKTLWLMPQYILSFKFNISQPNHTQIMMMKVNPITSGTAHNVTSNTAVLTNMAYLASCFELYRGGIGFNFKMAKTSYHSTRIAICYFNTESAPPTLYNTNFMNVYHEIWDIQESYEKTICIPYIQGIEWLNTSTNNDKSRDHLGYLGLYLVNSLQSGGGASNSVEVIVEVFACHDFEVAIPRSPAINDYWIRPITSLIQSSGSIRISKKDSKISKVILPWYLDYKMGSNSALNFDIPNDLYYSVNQQVITSIILNTEVKHGQIVITFANNSKKEINLIDQEYNNEPIGGLFVWSEENTITKQSLDDNRNLLAGKLHPNYTTADLSQITKEFKLLHVNHAFQLMFRRVRYNLEKHSVVHEMNKIILKKPQSFHFDGFDKFTNISKVHVLIDAYDKDHLVVTLTNEHGKINKKNIILQYLVVDPIKQQINYNEMIMANTTDNITGCHVPLSSVVDTTIGEAINSVRQLCSRYTYYSTFESTDAGEDSIADVRQYVIFDPIKMHNFTYSIVDYISHFAPFYRFWSGEIRYKFYIEREYVPMNEVVTIRMFNNYSSDKLPSFKHTVSSTVLHVPLIEGFGEFTVPYYNRNEKVIVGDVRNAGMLGPVSRRIVVSVRSYDKPFKLILFRAIGDNFAFGTKLSAPTVQTHKI